MTEMSCFALSSDWWGNYSTEYIYWDPATPINPDPTSLTVFEETGCSGNNWGVTKGVHTLNPSKNIKSYRVQ